MSPTSAPSQALLDRPEPVGPDTAGGPLPPERAAAGIPGIESVAEPVVTVLHVTHEDGDRGSLALAPEGPGAKLVLERISSMLEATLRVGDAAAPDVLLLDRLPAPDAASLIGLVRQRNVPTAIVVAVNAGEYDAALAALDAGADDYVFCGRTSPDALHATLLQAVTSRKARQSGGGQQARVLYAGDIETARQSLAQHAPGIKLIAPPAGPDGVPLMPDSPLPDGSAPYDVLVLEHGVPGIDALALLRDLAQSGTDIPVVVVTRPDQANVAAHALRRGAAASVFRTPLSPMLLGATISRLVCQAQLARNYTRVSRTASHLQAILETQPQGVLLVSRDGTVAGASAALVDAAGATTRQDLIGRSLFGLVVPGDREAARSLVRSVCDGEHMSARLEFSIGESLHVLDLDAVPMRIPSDGRTVMLALAREKPADEPAPAAPEPRPLSFFEAASGPTPMLILRDGCLLYANAAMAEMLAGTADGLAAARLEDIVDPESLERVAKAGTPSARRVRMLRKDGAECWALLHLSRVEFEGQGATLAVAFDVTASVAIERIAQELDARCDGLSREIAEKNAALAREKDLSERTAEECATERARCASLQEALTAAEARCRQLAEEASSARASVPAVLGPAVEASPPCGGDTPREKDLARQLARHERVGQLAVRVAGDWAAVLDAIDEHGRRLLSGNGHGGTEAGSDARCIVEAANRARPLTRQLLAFSRKQMQPAHPLDVNALLDRNVVLLRHLAGETIDLVFEADPTAGTAPADADDLQAAVTYLVLAARELLPFGGRVTCRTAPVPHGTSLSIEACGLGMDEGLQSALAAASEETSKGLAPVRQFLEANGARMNIEAEPGWKTTFTLHLSGCRQ